MPTHDIRTATADDRAAVIDTLTLAFSIDPPMRWVFPAASDYLAKFPQMAEAFGGKAFAQGTALVTADGAAAALWLAPGVEPDGEALGEIVMGAITEAQAQAAGGVFEAMAAYHPQAPHWYLPMVGVDPARQGEGLGGALLKAGLARCDADGLPAYLESSNPRNVPLYERHGFEVMGVIEPGDFPPLIPMFRAARG